MIPTPISAERLEPMPESNLRSANENSFPSRWARFRATKTYDFLVAIPLILWYALALKDKLPLLRHRSEQLFQTLSPPANLCN